MKWTGIWSSNELLGLDWQSVILAVQITDYKHPNYTSHFNLAAHYARFKFRNVA